MYGYLTTWNDEAKSDVSSASWALEKGLGTRKVEFCFIVSDSKKI